MNSSRSLKYCDMRLIDSCFMNRTALEQEVGMACAYVSKDVLRRPTNSAEAVELNVEKAVDSPNEGQELERPHSNGSAATRASSEYLAEKSALKSNLTSHLNLSISYLSLISI